MMNISGLTSAAAAAPSAASALQQPMTGALSSVDRLPSFIPASSDTPVLDKLALPDEQLQRLGPVLTVLGFTSSEGLLPQSDGGKTTFRFTQIASNDCRKALLYITKDVLTRYTRAAKLALEEVRDLFQGKFENRLYVFYDTEPVALFKNLMQDEWKEKYQVVVVFVPLSDLNDFDDMTIDQRMKYVKRVLELDDPVAVPNVERKPAQQMTVGELKRLMKSIVPDLPQFADHRGRKVFVETELGLKDFGREFNFEGAPGLVGAALVMKLWEGDLLGHLLQTLKTLADVPPVDQQYVCDLLERYSFEPVPGGP